MLSFLFSIPVDTWQIEHLQKYVETLKKKSSKIAAEDKDKILLRIKTAKEQQKWAIAIAELEILVGHDPDNMSFWLDLAVTAYQESSDESYRFRRKAEDAGYYVYLKTKDPVEKAKALLIIGATRHYEADQAITEAVTLADLTQLRIDFPEYKNILAFDFIEHAVDPDTRLPQVCFKFAHPLSKDFKPEDYLEITPKIDGAFSIRDNQICVTGIQFGEYYNVTVKEGIPSLFGEKITRSSKISFVVSDKSSRLSFPTQTYVLPKQEQLLVPLTAVNVKEVDLKIFRINDRSFIETFSRPHQGLDKTIYRYDWNTIENRYGELLYQGKMALGGDTNQNTTKQISLHTLIKDLKPGAYGIFVKGAEDVTASQWVLITDIGMTAFRGTSGLDINVRALSTASPVKNVNVQLLSYNNQILGEQKSNSDGWIHFDEALLRGKGANRPSFILIYGEDGSFGALKLTEPAFDLSDRGVGGRKVPASLDAFAYTERGVYRPGETVRINTLLRTYKAEAAPCIPLTFRLMRPDGVMVYNTQVTGNNAGFYELLFPLPESTRTGQWSVDIFLDPKGEAIGQVKFSVEDFVPSRLLVSLKSEKESMNLNEPLIVNLSSRYLFGSAAAFLKGDASLVLKHHPHPFPKYPGYHFGLVDDKFETTRIELPPLELDKDGNTIIQVTTKEQEIKTTLPLQAVVQATVLDPGGRPQLGTLKINVESFPLMIGIKAPDNIGFEDKTAEFDIITINQNEERVEGVELNYTLYNEEVFYNWSNESGKWEYKPVHEDKLLQSGTLKDKKLTVPTEEGGYYRLEVKDLKTGAASSVRFTKGYLSTESATQSPDKLTIVQDKAEYKGNEKIELHFDAPFDGEGTVVIANQEVIETRNIPISKKGNKVTLKADPSWGAGAYVLISAFRPLQAKENALMPKRAIGVNWISLSREPHMLDIAMCVPKEIKPRQKIEIPLELKGNLNSETFITLAAVDEGILSLTEFKTPNPLDYFFGKRVLGVEIRDLYGKIMNPMNGEIGEVRSGGDEGALARNLAALSKRSFKIISLFHGPIQVDHAGKANIEVEIPDFNGTLRLMALAFNQNACGNTESRLMVRDDVVVEPVFPRFLSIGDEAQIQIPIFHAEGDKKEVKVSVKTNEILSTTTLSEEENLLRISLKALKIGDGKITVTLSRKDEADIVHDYDLTVRPKTTPVTTIKSVLLKPGEKQEIKFNEAKDLITETRLVTIKNSSSVPWPTDFMVNNLLSYPYGCIEQVVSRGFAILSNNPSENEVFKTLAILAEKQDYAGGFPLWSFRDPADDLLTVYAFDFMHQVKQMKLRVPKHTYEKSVEWLKGFIQNQSYHSTPESLSIAAYALSLLAGEHIEDGVVRYFFDTHFNALPYTLSRVQVGLALIKIGDVSRTKRAFDHLSPQKEAKFEDLAFGSDIRNRAALITTMLEAVQLMPTLTDVLEKVQTEINLIMQQMTPNLSTQEQAWLLRAGKLLEKNYDQESNVEIREVMVDQSPGSASNFMVENKGAGNVWVRCILSGSPINPPKPEESGITIKRAFYDLNGKEVDVSSVKQGDQFIVLLTGTLIKASKENNVLVVDWLPAGFEIDGTRITSDKQGMPWENLTKTLAYEGRDDRLVAAIKLYKDDRSFRLAYRVRAVTPGTYIYPGLHVEDMFKPRIRANTVAQVIKIER